MIARAGTCVTLSLVIVVVATVVLHRPDRARAVAEVRGDPGNKNFARTRAKVSPSSPTPVEAANASPQVLPNRPKAGFERVREGETLADVARRVYGESADLQAFWKVNRDQLSSPEAEVRTGMVLRTPEL